MGVAAEGALRETRASDIWSDVNLNAPKHSSPRDSYIARREIQKAVLSPT